MEWKGLHKATSQNKSGRVILILEKKKNRFIAISLLGLKKLIT